MASDKMTVTITAVDKVSPTIRRIGRRLWWMRYGAWVTAVLIGAVLILSDVAAFLLGSLTV